MAAERDVQLPTCPVSLTVNGVEATATIEPRLLLVEFLRDVCGLTGTKIGCDTSTCGACTVLVEGRAAKSCTLLAVQAQGCSVLTIEGLATGSELHPVQRAFHEHHALQCGYCTPGMIMACVSLLQDCPEPTETSIRAALKGNVCRCTGYATIVDAVEAAARHGGGDA
jgi:aerobic carbon-monoxide dehydrogenase small subunit